MHADNFYDLVVYKKAFALQQRIFELTKTFPKEELYSLTDQIRRSSRSVGANIAEAWRNVHTRHISVVNSVIQIVNFQKHFIGCLLLITVIFSQNHS